MVEGNITRFLAIFNSTAPETIGPVRSVRLQDPDIVWPIGGIFAYSGGAADPVEAINAAPVHAVDDSAAIANGVTAMERNAPGNRRASAPHNLYGHGRALFSLGGDAEAAAAAVRRTRAGGAATARRRPGAPVISVVGFLAGYDPVVHLGRRVGHVEALAPGRAARRRRRRADRARERRRAVHRSTRRVRTAQTVGEGDVWVFSDGQLRTGRWSAPTRADRRCYVDAAGPAHRSSPRAGPGSSSSPVRIRGRRPSGP